MCMSGDGGVITCEHRCECVCQSEPWLLGLHHGDSSEAPTPGLGAPAGSRFMAGSRNSNQLVLPAEFSSQTN